jgi:hypothetical protein
MIQRLVLLVAVCVSIAGCGGGGSSVPGAQPASPTSSTLQSVTVSIAIPSAAAASSVLRQPKYVSVNTQSASISVNGGTPVVTNLAAGSPNCTTSSGARTCSITLSAPVGTDTFAEVTYASANGTGTALSQNTTTATIVAGKANVVPLVLDGVVASVALTLSNPTPPAGTAATLGLTVNLIDASGATIIGSDPFSNPVALTDSDPTDAKLSKTQLNSPADATGLTIAYDGANTPATFGATASGLAAANVKTATLTPAASSPATFVDWPTYGFDSQRSGFNPATGGITPASISQLHVAWQASLQATQTQPIVVTNIAGHQALIVVGSYNVAQAYDALSGALVWQTTLPKQNVQDCGSSGITGTAQYDKALSAIFMAAGDGNGAPNHVVLYRLDAATGTVQAHVDVTPTLEPGEANYGHTGVLLANGRIYIGTGSDCEADPGAPYVSWRGRLVSVDPAGMTLLSTFFTTWGQGGNFGGGGVWAWGAASADPSGNVYVGSGNAETNATVHPDTISSPFQATDNEQAGYAEHLVELTGDLSTVEGSNYPGFNFAIGDLDLDYAGTPVVFSPPGCGVLTAMQGKGGTLVINNTAGLGEVTSYKLSIPSPGALYIGNPGFSPTTGYLYAAITSAGNGSSMLPPGLAAIGSCGQSMMWHAQFGPDSAAYQGENPRSAPTVTAGGVVFMGTPCTPSGSGCGAAGAVSGALWAIDATTGSVLGGGNPVLITGDNIRMAPSADGLWLWVLDDSGNLSALTVDPTVKGITAKVGARRMPTFKIRDVH